MLWFAPAEVMEEHNYYGNVSYVIDWQVLLEAMGPNLYLIDQAIYKDRGYTRILLTRGDYDNTLNRVDLRAGGTAILLDGSTFYHAESCGCNRDRGPHELQIGIEASREDAEWIYRNCTASGNDHSSANTAEMRFLKTNKGERREYKPFKCFKFNTMQNQGCPFQLTKDQAEYQLAIEKYNAISPAFRDHQVSTADQNRAMDSTDDQNRAMDTEVDFSMNDSDSIPLTHSADQGTLTARKKKSVLLLLVFGIIIVGIYMIVYHSK